MAEPTTTTRIGPSDHGRQVSFNDFRDADAAPGYTYELARGVVQVVQIPGGPHAQIVDALHQQLAAYRYWNPDVIQLIASGADCRLEAPALATERHPDRAVYLTPRPKVDPPWSQWIPEIVIEVVSKGGEDRDYNQKRDDYLAVGVQEYWIVDPDKRTMLALTRRGDRWHEQLVSERDSYHTEHLPRFELVLKDIFSLLDRQ